MEPDQLIQEIQASGEARSILEANPGILGVSSAFMQGILGLYAEDIHQADELAKHWRAFLDLGDDRALAYRAKGIHDKINGRALPSARAFQKAGKLAKEPLDRFSFAAGAVDGLARAGKIDEALSFGAGLAQGLEHLDRPDLAARIHLNMGNAALWAERGDEARNHFTGAITLLQKGGFLWEEASARLGLSTSHLYGGNPKIARAEAVAAKAIADQQGLEYLSAQCEINLAHLNLLEGRADEAYASLLTLRTAFQDSPIDLARAHEFVGDACLRLNLFSEAVESYQAALAEGSPLSQTDQAHVLFGLGEAERDVQRADAYLGQAARKYKRIGNLPWYAATLAARATLQPQDKRSRKLAQTAVEAAGNSPYHQTLANLALAETKLVKGTNPSDELKESERLVRRFGYRRFVWKIHALRAQSSESPLPHYRRMFQEMMRDRLATSSIAARTGFLADKSAALGDYLSILLSAPTTRRVAEARDVIRRTRAATLFDEIFKSGSQRLNPNALQRLEELRAQIMEEAKEESSPQSRGTKLYDPPKRLWTEANHFLGALYEATPPSDAENCVVFIEASGNLWAIAHGKAHLLPISVAELEEDLKWLRFELNAATAHKSAPSEDALAILKDLRHRLVTPWLVPDAKDWRICPDGLLWQVPWDAVLEEGASISLHPSFSGGIGIGQISRVAVWASSAPDLPNAAIEEQIVLDKFPHASVFRTRDEVLGSLREEWDLVHVICHARHNSENPMFSTFEFCEGPVFAADIARSRLRTRLACLSACETGRISSPTQSEPDGLVRAFLARGCQSVIASLWPLDDEAASRFFGKLYTGMDFAKDLQSLTSLAREDVRTWREHPYFWASIALFAGYQQ